LAEASSVGGKPIQIVQAFQAYPREVRTFLRERAPAVVTGLGNIEILRSGKLALFCSVRCPGKLILATHDFCQELRNKRVTVIGGFHSPLERECLNVLLRGAGSIIICPARRLEGMRVPTELKPAMDQGRILYLSPFKDRQRRTTAQMAAYRNLFVAGLADSIFVAYAHPGSKTEELCRELLGWKKTVFALESDLNANLFGLGAQAVRAGTISAIDE
jgi:predicted Rossmann fold nucleotide-binding protein DprA/Smf involved in DNA uptake